MRDLQRSLFMSVPPFEFNDLPEAEIGDEVEEMMRHDQGRRNASLAAGLARNRAQGLPVQMIEMSMGDQHHIHGREVAQKQARTAQPLQDEQPAREVGVDDHVHAANLQEEAGVANEGQTQVSLGDQFWLVSLTAAWSDRGMADQAGELACSLA